MMFKKQIQKIKSYFLFTRSEWNGLLVLLMLIAVVSLLPAGYNMLFAPKPINDTIIVQAIAQLDVNKPKYNNYQQNNSYNTDYKQATLFYFDPNTATEAEFISLGIKDFIAKGILKYRSKGGKFKKPEDFKKVYNLREVDYNRVLPYIKIGSTNNTDAEFNSKPIAANTSTTNTYTPKSYSIDINSDSTTLLKIKGIGAKLASRIIKYRSKLGGFIALSQLKEVYGLDTAFERLTNINTLTVSSNISQININTDNVKLLGNHPYIGYNLANAIINYRKAHKPYTDISELKNIKIISEVQYQKMKPYLKVD